MTSKDAKWWQYPTWPFGSGEVKIKKEISIPNNREEICFGWFWQVAVWALDQSLFIKPIHICWSSAVKHKHLDDITTFYKLYFHLIIIIIIIIIKLYLQKHHVNYQLIIWLSTIFQLHRDGQFYWRGNWSTQRKPSTYHKSLTNFSHPMLYQVHLVWAGFELTTLVMICTNCIYSYKSNYQTITTITVPQLIRCGIYCISFYYIFSI